MRLQVLFGRVATAVTVAIAVMFSATPASAQKVPEPLAQEILIKGILMSFNDAIITGNYAVFHARLAKPFRDEFSPERLAGVFKAFRDQKINFAVIATKPPVASEPPRIDSGVLKLYGSFDTAPSRLNYLLEFVGSEGEWKASRVEVQLKPISNATDRSLKEWKSP
jgi:hypothetical protein